MEIGIGTWEFGTPESIDAQFRAIREAGMQCMDFDLSHFYHPSLIHAHKTEHDLTPPLEAVLETLRPYTDAAARHGIRLNQAHAPYPSYVDHPETDEAIRLSVIKCIEVCAALGTEHLIVHPGIFDRGLPASLQAEWEWNMTFYRSLIPTLKKTGVICCLENMFTVHNGRIIGAVCSDPQEAIAYIDALNAEAGETLFGFCLDTGHALLTGQDIGRFVTLLGDRLVTLHVHDNDGQRDQHIAPYMGKVDWDRFCAALGAVHYRGVFSFEVVKCFPDPVWPAALKMIGETGAMFARKAGLD